MVSFWDVENVLELEFSEKKGGGVRERESEFRTKAVSTSAHKMYRNVRD